MKKFMLLVCLAILPTVVQAQERVSLFDAAPPPAAAAVDNNTATEGEKPAAAQKTAKPVKAAPADVGLPRLGRQAEPLTSIVVEPVSGFTFGVDLAERSEPIVEPKQVVEPATPDSELIRRQESLTFVESDKKNMQKVTSSSSVNIGDLQRHDVRRFKLVGIKFGDDSATVYETLIDLGYSLQKIEKSIPRYRTTYYNDICRDKKGLKILSDIRKCVIELAEEDELHYVFRETYVRPESRETVQVSYSTPDTDNLVFKIVYENRGDTSLNSSPINMAKKFKRRDDFWDMVFKIYGLPDDSDRKIWGDYNTRYLKAIMYGSAYHAYLIMEDRIMQDKDYDAAQTDFKTLRKTTPFTFTGEVPDEDDE